MANYRDFAGQRFGRWTIIRMERNERGKVRWLCRCDCGTERVQNVWNLVHGRSTNCGCVAHIQPEITEHEIGWRLLVNRRITDSGCWEWTRKLNNKGYGIVSFKTNGTKLVHRIAAGLWLGFDTRSSLLVCHHCDNPLCFNPWHLFIGTHSDNTLDSVTKGRFDHLQNGALGRAKTHCPKGHEYTPANTVVTKAGTRACRECRKAACRRWYTEATKNNIRPKDKTLCKHGHQYTPDNTIIDKRGRRSCKACKRIGALARYHRNKTKGA